MRGEGGPKVDLVWSESSFFSIRAWLVFLCARGTRCAWRPRQVQEGKEAMWDQLGTPSYMAPELWSESAKEYDSSVDMWALGVVTFMLLSGKRPFHHQDRKEKARMIKHDPLVFRGAVSPYLDPPGLFVRTLLACWQGLKSGF